MRLRQNSWNEWGGESGYKIRCMRSLARQIKEDYAEWNRLCEKLEKGPMELSEEEELLRVMCWLREGLNVFKELKKSGIEGVSWGEMEEIEKDVRIKENNLKTISINKRI